MKMRRFKRFLCAVLALVLCLNLTVSAENTVTKMSATGTVVNVSTSLTVRETPEKDGKVVGSVRAGATVSITGECGDWYQIIYNSQTAYVNRNYISTEKLSEDKVVSMSATAYIKVTNYLNVRKSPDASAEVVARLKNNTKISIKGETSGWYKITYNGSNIGYVNKNYVTFTPPAEESPAEETAFASKETEAAKETGASKETQQATKATTAKGTSSEKSTTKASQSGSASYPAYGEVYNIRTSLTVRRTAEASGAVMGSLKSGTQVVVTGEKNGFYAIKYNGKDAYASASFIKITGKAPESAVKETTKASETTKTTTKAETSKAETTKAKETTKAVQNSKDTYPAYGEVYNIRSSLTVRRTAASDGAVMGSLKNGADIIVTGEKNGYYAIRYNGKDGYASSAYIRLTGKAPESALTETSKAAETTAKATTKAAETTAKETTKAAETTAKETTKAAETTAKETTKAAETTAKETTKAEETTQAAETFKTVDRIGYANVKTSLNARKTADKTAGSYGEYSRGDMIIIVGESDNWYKVKYSGKYAYVPRQYVSLSPVLSDTFKSVSLRVPKYYQYDSRWASVRLGAGVTMKSAGCVTTSLAMVEEYRTGKTCTPLQMYSKLSYTSGGNVYWPKGTTQYSGKNYLERIYQQLKAGNPVIIGAKWANSNDQHYVVVTGYTGSSSKLSASGFTVNDPGTAGAKTLAQFLARTPRFYKIIYYN